MYLANDVIQYLLDTVGGGAQDGEHRVLRQSLAHAYRDLVVARDWRWYATHDQLIIDRRYVEHLLPWGVQSVDSFELHDSMVWDMLGKYITPRDFQRLYDSDWNELISVVWTIDKDPVAMDRYRIRILCGGGYTPGTATLTYRRRPRDLRLTGFEPRSRQGTVDWQGVDVRGSNSAFSNQMLGAVIRVSGDPKYAPESLTGITPYIAEGVIYSVPSSDKLLAFSEAGHQTILGTRYIISDFLDISPGMYSALLSGSEYWAARLLGKNIDGAYALYGRDLRLAFENDEVAVLTGREHLCHCGCEFWWIRPGTDQGVGGPGSGGPNENGPCKLKEDLHGGDADSEATQEWAGSVTGGDASTTFDDCGTPR